MAHALAVVGAARRRPARGDPTPVRRSRARWPAAFPFSPWTGVLPALLTTLCHRPDRRVRLARRRAAAAAAAPGAALGRAAAWRGVGAVARAGVLPRAARRKATGRCPGFVARLRCAVGDPDADVQRRARQPAGCRAVPLPGQWAGVARRTAVGQRDLRGAGARRRGDQPRTDARPQRRRDLRCCVRTAHRACWPRKHA
ncbi:MAG: hypothetical protein MZW92_41170 [Comamonadaceae bacterium]|nr:hypothetical protein [Comamonadaceae bacterium]